MWGEWIAELVVFREGGVVRLVVWSGKPYRTTCLATGCLRVRHEIIASRTYNQTLNILCCRLTNRWLWVDAPTRRTVINSRSPLVVWHSPYRSIQWALQYGVYLLSGTHLRGGGAICGTRYGILAARPRRGTPYVQFTTAWLAIACNVSRATTRFCLVSPGSS